VTVYRLCCVPGCGQLIERGNRCQVHMAEKEARKALKRKTSGYYSKHWQQLRKAALNRDLHTCQRCGAPATTVHIDPRLRANHHAATLADCTSLCHSCHGSIDTRRRHAHINAAEQGEGSSVRTETPIPDGPLVA
jgi:5-methylcytosine-specific restriction endonuclease McrA